MKNVESKDDLLTAYRVRYEVLGCELTLAAMQSININPNGINLFDILRHEFLGRLFSVKTIICLRAQVRDNI